MNRNLIALRKVISESKKKVAKELEKPLELKHGWLLPYLLQADDFLWGRWNHWGETMMAGKITDQPIPQIQWERGAPAMAMLENSLNNVTRYGDWRGWSSWQAFDYFMDWLLFGFGYKGQCELPQKLNDSCYGNASERLYQVFNLETLLAWPYDYFGDILAENKHGRSAGFFPTPMCITDMMTRMTFGEGDHRAKSTCDPAVGTGRMLLASSNYSYRLFGMDINATVIKATIINGYLYAPWLSRPFPFLDRVEDSKAISDGIARQCGAENTEHDEVPQFRFAPVKKRRQIGIAEEQGILLEA